MLNWRRLSFRKACSRRWEIPVCLFSRRMCTVLWLDLWRSYGWRTLRLRKSLICWGNRSKKSRLIPVLRLLMWQSYAVLVYIASSTLWSRTLLQETCSNSFLVSQEMLNFRKNFCIKIAISWPKMVKGRPGHVFCAKCWKSRTKTASSGSTLPKVSWTSRTGLWQRKTKTSSFGSWKVWLAETLCRYSE